MTTAPSRRTTYARPTSPSRGSGTPTTAASTPSGWRASACSISAGYALNPPTMNMWKPVIAAVNGMACGGPFYLLGECEFVIAAEHATFFDPHTSYGMVSAYEAIAMAQRMPYGEVMRMALMGTAERIGARRAHETGLVSEVVPGPLLLGAALRAAAVLAAHPTEAVQGTIRAVWSAHEAARAQAFARAPHLIALGNLPRSARPGCSRTAPGSTACADRRPPVGAAEPYANGELPPRGPVVTPPPRGCRPHDGRRGSP